MKKLKTAFIFLLVSLSLWAQSDIPYLRRTGTATQLIVEGKPFLMLGGELGIVTVLMVITLGPVIEWLGNIMKQHLNIFDD